MSLPSADDALRLINELRTNLTPLVSFCYASCSVTSALDQHESGLIQIKADDLNLAVTTILDLTQMAPTEYAHDLPSQSPEGR